MTPPLRKPGTPGGGARRGEVWRAGVGWGGVGWGGLGGTASVRPRAAPSWPGQGRAGQAAPCAGGAWGSSRSPRLGRPGECVHGERVHVRDELVQAAGRRAAQDVRVAEVGGALAVVPGGVEGEQRGGGGATASGAGRRLRGARRKERGWWVDGWVGGRCRRNRHPQHGRPPPGTAGPAAEQDMGGGVDHRARRVRVGDPPAAARPARSAHLCSRQNRDPGASASRR